METQQIIQMERKDMEDLLSMFTKRHSEAEAYAKFYNVLVPASWVAKIHGVCYQTVFRYIQRGLIIPEERTGREEHYLFRLSDVLKMDFKKFQRQLRRNTV